MGRKTLIEIMKQLDLDSTYKILKQLKSKRLVSDMNKNLTEVFEQNQVRAVCSRTTSATGSRESSPEFPAQPPRIKLEKGFSIQERTLAMDNDAQENKLVTNPYAPSEKSKPALPKSLITEKVIPSDIDMEVKPKNGADPTVMIKKAPFYRGFGRRVKTQPKMSEPYWPSPFDHPNRKPDVKSEIKSEHVSQTSSMDIDGKVKVPKPPKLERDSDEEATWLHNTNGFLFPPKGYKPVKVDRRRKYPKDPEWKPGT